MNILLISSQWSPKNQTGLGFASLQHFKYLFKQGYNVKCVSLDDDSKDYNLRIKSKINFILYITILDLSILQFHSQFPGPRKTFPLTLIFWFYCLCV